MHYFKCSSSKYSLFIYCFNSFFIIHYSPSNPDFVNWEPCKVKTLFQRFEVGSISLFSFRRSISLHSKRFRTFFRPSAAFFDFWRRKIGASATLMEGARGGGMARKGTFLPSPPPSRTFFCARPNFRAFKKRKMLQTCGKPYTTETLATQAIGQ